MGGNADKKTIRHGKLRLGERAAARHAWNALVVALYGKELD